MMTRNLDFTPSNLLVRSFRGDGTNRRLPLGVLEMFKIGIGPSLSHTMGAMKAAMSFVRAASTPYRRRSSIELKLPL